MRFALVLAALFLAAGAPNPVAAKIAPQTCLETLHVTPTGVKNTTAYVRTIALAPNTSGIWHKHAAAEIVYVSDGSIAVQRKGKADQIVSEDQSVLLQPGTEARLTNKSHASSRVVMTFIGAGGVSYIATGKEKEPFKPCSPAKH